jgi:hypothetical protein
MTVMVAPAAPCAMPVMVMPPANAAATRLLNEPAALTGDPLQRSEGAGRRCRLSRRYTEADRHREGTEKHFSRRFHDFLPRLHKDNYFAEASENFTPATYICRKPMYTRPTQFPVRVTSDGIFLP